MFSEAEINLIKAARVVRFKKYILSLDIPSRLFVLEACSRFLDSFAPSEPNLPALKQWFSEFTIITEDDDKPMRKSESTSRAIWDKLSDIADSVILNRIFDFVY